MTSLPSSPGVAFASAPDEAARTTRTLGYGLIRLAVLCIATALVAVSLALLVFQLREGRESAVTRLRGSADLIAYNIAAAVDFADAESANHLLAALRTRPEVTDAGVMIHGRLFASYVARGVAALTPPKVPEGRAGYTLMASSLTVFRPITARGRVLGTLFIRADIQDVGKTLRRFAAVTALVAIPALLLGVFVFYSLQKAIARPLLDLADLAKSVSATNDYSVRAAPASNVAEIRQLIATFNQMLGEIEQQHNVIEDARLTLEARVIERTSELALRAEQLEEQRVALAAANDELESFSYSVSHDLRAPLRAIDGFSRALLESYPAKQLDERGIHYLDRVRAGTQRMATLIDDMLHLARVSRRSLVRTEVDVTAIAQQAVADLQKAHPERSVLCEIEPDLRAWADHHLLMIVFANLVGNAWKFTGNRADGRIEIGQLHADDGKPFYVRDNGAGFNMTYADKLFGPFQRLHSDSEFEGTGIGLATVKRIIVRHGGKIWAESTEGEGATFYLTLGAEA